MFGRDPIFCVDQILDPKIREPVALTDDAEFKMKLVNSLRQAWEAAAEANKEAQLKAKAQYDKLVRPLTINVGDRVLLRNYAGKIGTSKKFHLPWKGIFRVIEINGVLVTITSCSSPQSNPRVVHVNQLKKCIEGNGPICSTPELPPDEIEALDEAQAEEVSLKAGYSHKTNQKAPLETIVEEESTENAENPQGELTNYNLRQNRKRNPKYLNLVYIPIIMILCFADVCNAVRNDKDHSPHSQLLWVTICCLIVAGLQIGYLANLAMQNYRNRDRRAQSNSNRSENTTAWVIRPIPIIQSRQATSQV
jgi:hypothetical protein